jgi:plasmid stabilization system protein ParE
MKLYSVRLSSEAQDDLERLHLFWLAIDPDVAQRAIDAIDASYAVLARTPFICRKANEGRLGPRWRELLIDFGSSGFVALFEIEDGETVTIVAIRHQRESDYH